MASLTSSAGGAPSQLGQAGSALTRRPSFYIDSVSGAVIGAASSPDMRSTSSSASSSPVPVAPEAKRKGMFSWLGC